MNNIKVVGKHHKDCYARRNYINGLWDTCWGPVAYGVHGDPVITTSRNYGKGRKFTTWLRYVCNDTKCPAELHIDVDYILQLSGEKVIR